MIRPLVVGSRRSALAMTQTHWVCDRLTEKIPDLDLRIEGLTTQGDRNLGVSLSKIGGKGLFTKEIEQALLSREIDFAVHSYKDVPAQMPEGLVIAAVPRRVDARDALISDTAERIEDLPVGAVVGTSSLRRSAQLKRLRPDLRVEPLRGNIDTRLKRLQSGEMDAMILASAGLIRMGWDEVIRERLSVRDFVPAIAQGALAIQCRAEDEETRGALALLHDVETETCVNAERIVLRQLNGGCQVPMGAYAVKDRNGYRMSAMVASPDGAVYIRVDDEDEDAERLGYRVAERLLQEGGREVVERALKEANT